LKPLQVCRNTLTNINKKKAVSLMQITGALKKVNINETDAKKK